MPVLHLLSAIPRCVRLLCVVVLDSSLLPWFILHLACSSLTACFDASSPGQTKHLRPPPTLRRIYESLGAQPYLSPCLTCPPLPCLSPFARRGCVHCSSRTKSGNGQRSRHLNARQRSFSNTHHGARRRLLSSRTRRPAERRLSDRLRHRHGRLSLRIVVAGRHALVARCARPQA